MVTVSDEGGIVLNDNEIEALARYLIGLRLTDTSSNIIEWEDVDLMAERTYTKLDSEIMALGEQLVAEAANDYAVNADDLLKQVRS